MKKKNKTFKWKNKHISMVKYKFKQIKYIIINITSIL